MFTKSRLVFLTAFIVFACFITVSSCNKDKDDPGQKPELPPMESFLMDFSDFSDPDDTLQPGKKSIGSLLNGYTYRNWGHSFLTVAFWNTIVTVTLALPASCYLETIDSEPVYMGEGIWQWTATNIGMNASYDVKILAKKISNENYLAQMFVSSSGEPAFTDFKWIEGALRYDHTHAVWTVFESPYYPESRILDIEWDKNWETGTGNMRYTYIKTNADLKGSLIEYQLTSDPVYNSRYIVNLVGDSARIEWNSSTKNGHVKDYRFYGDTNWHCWNNYLQDISCE